jgi:hypothetical protein
MVITELSIKERLVYLEGVKSDIFEKIPCLIGGKCELHQEIINYLKIIEAMLNSNRGELEDLRQGVAIILEEHGIPCDEIKGWDINKYRELKNVRGKGVQNTQDNNAGDHNGKSNFIKRKKQERKRKKARRGKKNVN